MTPGPSRSLTSALILVAACGADSRPSVSPETERFLAEYRDPRTWEPLGDELLAGLPDRVRDPRTGIEFALVPPGEFEMGGWAPAEKPLHRVRITRPFYMGQTEVTFAQWRRWITEHGGEGDLPVDDSREDHPVTGVSWHQAQAFCSRYGYELPTEAQWEYAARGNATEGEEFWENPDILDDYSWNGNNSGGVTHPVGTRKPNGFGLHDMLGNVWEWCRSWHADGYDVDLSQVTADPPGPPAGILRSLRGGSWFTLPAPRPSDRSGDRPEARNDFYGFRVIRAVDG